MPTLLYLTDFWYPANGRAYYSEDLYLTGRLKEHFPLLIGHPQQALDLIHCADAIVFRNTGPVMHYREYFQQFVTEVQARGIPTFNSFDGKGDQQGKEYLVALTRAGYPVIPTADSLQDLPLLGPSEEYILKMKAGADSIGMERLSGAALEGRDLSGRILQPFVPFHYEVSFYFINDNFQYALYAPDPAQRWALTPYEATAEDLRFARQFIEWNGLTRGITRVDACRLPDGRLLLVELEDLNPYLSLDVLEESVRERFVAGLIAELGR